MKVIYMSDTINYIYQKQGPKALKALEDQGLTRVDAETVTYFIINDVD